MDPSMKSWFSYGWDVIEVYHKGMLSINDLLNMLQLRMKESHALFEPVSTQENSSTPYNDLLIGHSILSGQLAIQVWVEK